MNPIISLHYALIWVRCCLEEMWTSGTRDVTDLEGDEEVDLVTELLRWQSPLAAVLTTGLLRGRLLTCNNSISGYYVIIPYPVIRY